MMDNTIVKVLDELEKRSSLEKEHKLKIERHERMLAITKDTGELFNILLHSKKCKNMLEIGTSVGYSTIWCAEAVKKNSGKIITIEKDQEKIQRAQKNFSKAGVQDIIEIRNGTALDVLESLHNDSKFNGFFDFVLIDADKENTTKYFDLILPMIKIGALIAIDNMLYPTKYRDEMKRVEQYIQGNSNVRAVMIPIGNGEEIVTKLSE